MENNGGDGRVKAVFLDGEVSYTTSDDAWDDTSGLLEASPDGRRLAVVVGAALAPAALAMLVWRVVRRRRA